MSCLIQTSNVMSSLDCSSKYTVTDEKLVRCLSIGHITNHQFPSYTLIISGGINSIKTELDLICLHDWQLATLPIQIIGNGTVITII